MVCAIGLGVGIINGLLVEAAQIDSFIATLGTGSILYAVSIAYTGGQQIVGQLPGGFCWDRPRSAWRALMCGGPSLRSSCSRSALPE